jgi:hypothetical protein
MIGNFFRNPAVKTLEKLGYGASTYEKFKDVLPEVPRSILNSNTNMESMIRAMLHAARNSPEEHMLPLSQLSANSSLVAEAVEGLPYDAIKHEAVEALYTMISKAPAGQKNRVYNALQANGFFKRVFMQAQGSTRDIFMGYVRERLEEDNNPK